jgi:hypothetical protein
MACLYIRFCLCAFSGFIIYSSLHVTTNGVELENFDVHMVFAVEFVYDKFVLLIHIFPCPWLTFNNLLHMQMHVKKYHV